MVCHRQNISFTRLIKKAFAYGESLAHLTKKHFSNKVIFQIPKFGQYKFNGGFIIIVVTQNFAKFFLLMLVIIISLYISFIITAIILVIVNTYFFFNIRFSIIRKGYNIPFWQNIAVLFLFIFRELAEEIGRIYGSLKYRVICM